MSGAKPTADEVLKTFKGLAIAAARARELAVAHGKPALVGDLPRRQQDSIRQQLLEIERDLQQLLQIMTKK